MAYYAVAFTKLGGVEKFGPPFVSEMAAWKWLHTPGIDTPPHDYIEVLEYFEYIRKWEDSISQRPDFDELSVHIPAEVEDFDLLPF